MPFHFKLFHVTCFICFGVQKLALCDQTFVLSFQPGVIGPIAADNDVWMCAAVKPCVFAYWEYILCYVDDILSVSGNPKRTMDGIKTKFKFKLHNKNHTNLRRN